MSRVVLKSRTETPSCGWFFRQPETGWSMPGPKGLVFTQAVEKIIAHRMANPALLSSKSTNPDQVADELDAFICSFLGNDPRWCKATEGALPKAQAPASPGQPKPSVLVRLAAAVKVYTNGASTLLDWFGIGGTPVAEDLAQMRAEICRSCWKRAPRNPLTAAAAEAILEAERLMQSAEMELPGDPLGSCGVCGCHLPLKVWVPRQHLEATRDPGHSFPGHCWMNGDPVPAPKTAPPVPGKKSVITVQRWAARGDVIACMPVVTRLWELGYSIRFATVPACIEALRGHPHIAEFVEIESSETKVGDINLDWTYERSKERQRKPLARILFESAAAQASKIGIDLGQPANLIPTLPESITEPAIASLARYPRPWIIVIPRSNAFVNKTVPVQVWDRFASLMKSGTVFWSGTDTLVGPTNLVDLNLRTFRHLMGVIAQADVVVSVDTGPLWVAQAYRRPIVYVAQSGAGILRISEQVDWTQVNRDLPCINCQKDKCPIDEANPPCANINADELASAVTAKLQAYDMDTPRVSAIIPLYKPDRARLVRCLDSVLPQVDEVVLSMDGPEPVPSWLEELVSDKPNVRVVGYAPWGRKGYGHTCNRGARFSRGTHLLMLNDDCFLGTNSVKSMMAMMASRPKCAVAGCLLRYPDGRIQHGGTLRDPNGYGHRDHLKTTPSISIPTEMEFVTFAAAIVKRGVFFELGGFDEHFDCYHEDSDFCLRARKAGYSVWYDPMASGIHAESLTSGPMKQELYKASRPYWWKRWEKYFTANAGKKGLGQFP